jgi:protein involved in sex pheromone biosynthesis
MENDIKYDDRTTEEKNIIMKVYGITLGLMECRYWIDCEEENNYLTEHDINEGNVATFNMVHYTVSEYVANLIEEMFSFSLSYDKYTGNMDDIVAGNICPFQSSKDFRANPLKAVSEPEYSSWGKGWDEGQYLDPDSLIHYLEQTSEHGLDIDQVSKIFKIGEYAWEREATKEELAEYYG